jgi:hypothetical protein
MTMMIQHQAEGVKLRTQGSTACIPSTVDNQIASEINGDCASGWLILAGLQTWLCSTVQLFDTLTFACLLCGTLLVTRFTLGTLCNFGTL